MTAPQSPTAADEKHALALGRDSESTNEEIAIGNIKGAAPLDEMSERRLLRKIDYKVGAWHRLEVAGLGSGANSIAHTLVPASSYSSCPS